MIKKIIKRKYYQGPVGTSPFVYAGMACNNNCIYCFEKDQLFFDKGTKKLKEEIRIIRKKFNFINFMGKEPTLRKDLLELIKYAKKIKFQQIGITTNGRMLSYKDFLEKLIKHGLNQVVITVAGHTPHLHEKHTLAKESFKQTTEGIENAINLKGHGLNLVLNIMVTQDNYKDLEKIVDFYVDLGVREMNIGHILPFNKEIVKSKKIIARMKNVVPYLIKIQNKYKKNVKFLFVEYPPCVLPSDFRCLSFPCLEESPQKKTIFLVPKMPISKNLQWRPRILFGPIRNKRIQIIILDRDKCQIKRK